jgi:hypothetical protein
MGTIALIWFILDQEFRLEPPFIAAVNAFAMDCFLKQMERGFSRDSLGYPLSQDWHI